MFGGHLNRRSFWRLPPKSQSTPLLADNHTRLDNSYLLSDNKCNGTGQTKESSGRQAGRAHHAPFDERRAQGPLRCCQESGPVHFQVRKKTDREVTTMENEEKKPRGKRGQGCLYRVNNSRNWHVKFSVDGRIFQESANTESKREATDFLKARILACSNG